VEAQLANGTLAAVFVQVQQSPLRPRIRRRLAFLDYGLKSVPVERTRQHEAAEACADDRDRFPHTSCSFPREHARVDHDGAANRRSAGVCARRLTHPRFSQQDWTSATAKPAQRSPPELSQHRPRRCAP